MSYSKSQHGAYTSHQREGETVRETDARALLSCASRLDAARKPECSKEDFIEAVKHNQQLWTVFQVCVTEPDSQLPPDIKVMLFNISRYVDKTSFQAIAEHDPELLISMININRQLAAGLSARQEGGPDQTPGGTTPSAPPENHTPIITSA